MISIVDYILIYSKKLFQLVQSWDKNYETNQKGVIAPYHFPFFNVEGPENVADSTLKRWE